jgi:hypothetical protein
MNKPQNDNRTIEDQLADFTDQILEENANQDKNPFVPDPELRALEQTALRLKNAFREDGPSEAVIERMRQNIVLQWKQQESKTSEPFWKRFLSACQPFGQKWQSQRNRQRWNLAVFLATAAFLMLVSIPLLNKVSSIQPAASGQNLNVTIFIAFGGLILLALWFFRRKP